MKQNCLFLAIATLLSVSLGLYNNFPFLYPDSSAYLWSGISGQIPDDRPIWYGWFLRHTHMKDNLFFPIIAQGLLSSGILFLFFKKFSPVKNWKAHFLVSVLVLTLCTGYSFFCSYLMPDIFTAQMILILSILFFAENTKLESVILVIIGILACSVHNAHFVINLLVFSALSLFIIYKRAEGRKFWVRRFLLAGLVPCLAVFFGIMVNHQKTGQAVLTRNGHIFLTSRLNETGILQEFLNRKCGQNEYAFCAYKDSLTADFLWDSKSPLHKLGGWKAPATAFDPMLHDILTDGRFLKRFVSSSFYSTLQQLFSFEIEPHNSLKMSYIREAFPLHLHDMDISMQNRSGRLNFKDLNERQWILVLSSFVLLCLALNYAKNLSDTHRRLIKFFFVALLANAFVCATFSTVLVRYQGRVIFLLPLLLLLILPTLPLKKKFFRVG